MEIGFFHMAGVAAIITWFVMWLDYRSKLKAKKNGCICNLGDASTMVIFLRHDCPYHYPKSE